MSLNVPKYLRGLLVLRVVSVAHGLLRDIRGVGFFALLVFAPQLLAQAPYLIAYNEASATMIPLVQAVYSELGISVVFELVPSERALHDANRGVYDADVSRVSGMLAAYPDLIYCLEPMSIVELLPYVRKGDSLRIESAEQLQRYRVGLGRGSKLAEGFVASAGITPVLANNLESLTNMLTAGRFDVALITTTQLSSQGKALASVAEQAGPALLSRPALHVLNRRNTELIPRFDAVLRKMKADGRLAALLQKK